MQTIVTINGVAYNASQRAHARILPGGLQRSLEGGYDSFTFSELVPSAFPSFAKPWALTVTIDGTLRFSGMIVDVQSRLTPHNWLHGYTAYGLKYLADQNPIWGEDGTGTQTYNRQQDDPYYNASDAGLSIGTMIRRILCIPDTATALDAIGVGRWASLSPPTLPAVTLSDLAALNVVPPDAVTFQGSSLFNQLEQILARWMPTFYLDIEPDGTIRALDSTSLTTFVPRTFTCPSMFGAGDPITVPEVRRSWQDCASRLVIRGGPDVEATQLSQADGTLATAWPSSLTSPWNLTQFTNPQGAVDYGTITAITSTSATLRSHDPAVHWVTNFWSNRDAWITMINPLASAISVNENRIVTANDALAAGATATVHWDGDWPIDNSGYTQYRIAGSASDLTSGTFGPTDVYRVYTPREPSTGATGLNTWVGSHLVTRSPKPIQYGNSAKSYGSYYATTGYIVGPGGQSLPLGLEPVPALGVFRFTQPTVTVYGQTSYLNSHNPTTAANGLPVDVQIVALYSRGALSVTVPPDIAGVPQYQGTCYTQDGYENTNYLDYSSWIWRNDASSFSALAAQHLASLQDTVVDISFDWILDGTTSVPGFDYLSFGYAVNVAIAGTTSPWSAINAPVRTIGVTWFPSGGEYRQLISISASTRRRPFGGDDLYTHPQFREASALSGMGAGGGGSAMATGMLSMMLGGGQSAMAEGRKQEGNADAWNDRVKEMMNGPEAGGESKAEAYGGESAGEEWGGMDAGAYGPPGSRRKRPRTVERRTHDRIAARHADEARRKEDREAKGEQQEARREARKAEAERKKEARKAGPQRKRDAREARREAKSAARRQEAAKHPTFQGGDPIAQGEQWNDMQTRNARKAAHPDQGKLDAEARRQDRLVDQDNERQAISDRNKAKARNSEYGKEHAEMVRMNRESVEKAERQRIEDRNEEKEQGKAMREHSAGANPEGRADVNATDPTTDV